MPAQISFTRGVPSADMLPVESSAPAASEALEREPAVALSYGCGAGHPGLRAWIAARHGVDAERVVCSNGSLQALLFLSELLVGGSGGRRVLVEAPTYDRVLILLRRAGAEPVGVPSGAAGLERRRARGRAAPQRPAGVRVRHPDVPEPERRDAAARGPRAADRARPRARLHHRRGRPVRPPALPRRRAPSLLSLAAARAWSRSPRSPRRSPPASASATPSRRSTWPPPLTKHANDTYIAPSMLSEATLAAYCAAGPLRARRRSAPPQPCRSAARRWSRPSPSTSRPRHPLHRARRRLLPLGRDARAPTPTPCCSRPTAAGVPYVHGSDFFAGDGGRRPCGWRSRPSGPPEVREGIARLGAIVARAPATA